MGRKRASLFTLYWFSRRVCIQREGGGIRGSSLILFFLLFLARVPCLRKELFFSFSFFLLFLSFFLFLACFAIKSGSERIQTMTNTDKTLYRSREKTAGVPCFLCVQKCGRKVFKSHVLPLLFLLLFLLSRLCQNTILFIISFHPYAREYSRPSPFLPGAETEFCAVKNIF